jgi:hypothetical protein
VFRKDGKWFHCSSRGIILTHIIANPYSTTDEIAQAVGRTTRSVWQTVGELLRSGQIRVHRHRRKNHYLANMDAPFLHPTIRSFTVGDVFGRLAPRKIKVNVNHI